MFGIFKKKSKEEKLQEKYNALMKEWHTLSSINRLESDKKYVEAQEVLEELMALQKN
ncbi:Lacal_2735 family protein [Arenibacter sp. F26102]|uniref:Lacal_2735 family protein n=1 Tax=Arenibacter sp. F26102 TaxID=2926416 RepID=UPI001FF30D35|nr:Lacal_2735 family protein [Arenibacter sp. F26102]MCK0144932.1 Lacal_2735 family protein [Arenibacter sp. F26102]